MYRFLFLLTIVMLSGNLFGQQQIDDKLLGKCQELRNGKFLLEDKKKNHKSIITRSDSIQIEEILTEDIEVKYKVKWISDCQYTLEPLSYDETHPLYMILLVNIDSVVGDILYYTVSPVNRYEMKKSFEMKILE